MGDSEHLVRLRGLPWSSSAGDVIKFLDDCEITNAENGVHFTKAVNGRASGEAYVELASAEDVKKALAKDKCHIGRRYIDVFKARKSEMDLAMNSSSGGNDCVVRLRGLPFGCSKEEIAHFFAGLPISPNGITILTDYLGRTTGQAFVQFPSQDLVEKALQRHKATIGRRYIEVFKSSSKEQSSLLTQVSRNQSAPFVGLGANFQGGPFGRGLGPNHFPNYSHDDYFGMQRVMRGRGSSLFGGNMQGRGFHDDGFYNCGSGANFGGNDHYEAGPRPGFGFGVGRGNMPNARGGGVPSLLGPMGGGGRAGATFSRGGGGNNRKSRPFIGGYNNNSRNAGGFVSQTGFHVHMHGLPYSATEADIVQFFFPLTVMNVAINYNADGRPSGDADVDFATEDEARMAMKRNRAMMQKRYVELFLNVSPPSVRPARGGFSGQSGFSENNFGSNYRYGSNAYNNCTTSF